mmetsp:Transcript_22933/g.79646  ORF Transcript_22933/g.79646 Transcript_22933/m.79646 type:complete len:414 (-) Transcript_22933:264-1505(-)
MWARGGQTRRAPSFGGHLMTGEFVAVSTAAGDAPWSVGRILGFGSSHDLPEGHPDRTAGDGGDFVLVQWCAIVGEEGHARGMPPPDDATKSAGRREIVLLRESSWHPIACILDAVIILSTCSSHDISGMDGVFVAKFEQGARGTFSRVAADSVGAFPERNATFGVDASGRRLVHVSRTSKLWMASRRASSIRRSSPASTRRHGPPSRPSSTASTASRCFRASPSRRRTWRRRASWCSTVRSQTAPRSLRLSSRRRRSSCWAISWATTGTFPSTRLRSRAGRLGWQRSTDWPRLTWCGRSSSTTTRARRAPLRRTRTAARKTTLTTCSTSSAWRRRAVRRRAKKRLRQRANDARGLPRNQVSCSSTTWTRGRSPSPCVGGRALSRKCAKSSSPPRGPPRIFRWRRARHHHRRSL